MLSSAAGSASYNSELISFYDSVKSLKVIDTTSPGVITFCDILSVTLELRLLNLYCYNVNAVES